MTTVPEEEKRGTSQLLILTAPVMKRLITGRYLSRPRTSFSESTSISGCLH